ncbi:mechanosensitive ion channel domain-containing protein [Stappia indica]|uniref:Mechanosensitive ion channel n=1 Tax=Stappia indica TaxID=538381 RepID=A0A857C797_9HYPH|nr:mechanosensitive ion channel domain-containing protein [Stappia indica]QGZ34801.1 mechanosensitive ion channel [Stappia indica]
MPCNGRFARLLPLLLAALLLLPPSLAGPVFAQSGQPATQQTGEQASGSPAGAAQAVAQTRQDAEALIRLLQDPGARGALIDYLQRDPAAAPAAGAPSGAPASPPAGTAPSEASPAAAEGEVAPAEVERQPTHIALRIANATQNVLAEGMVYVERIARSFTSLPTALSYSAGANWERVQSILLQLAIIALAVFAIVSLLHRLADRLFARLIGHDQSMTVVKRVTLLVLHLVAEAAVVAVALGAGYAIALYTGENPRHVELVESLFLNAFFFIQAAKVLTRFALSPEFAALRLVPLDDEQALYWRRWLFTIYNVLGYGTMVVVPLIANNISFLLADSVRMMIVLASVAIAISAIMRNRLATRERILGYGERQSNLVTTGLVEIVARTWHIVAIIYVLLLLGVWLSRPFDAVTFMVRATAMSVLTVMVGTIVSLALTRTISGGVRLPQNVHERLPMLERRLNTFVPRVLSLVRLAVFVGVILGILHAWGMIDALSWFSTTDGQDWTSRMASAGIILGVGFLIWLAVMSWVDLRLNPRGRLPTSREKTLFNLFRNAFSILLVVMITLLALSEIGVNIGPLIAGAGVFGLAISFGSQKLVQDIITGAFIQFENAMNEGDVVTLGGVTGTVEKLTIRSVRLRDIDGTAHMIPFSTVDRVANFMRGWAYHVAAIGVAYDSDLTEVKLAMHAAFDRLMQTDYKSEILEPLEMHGITMFGDSAITVRARIKTRPGSQWAVGRAYNEYIKAVFDERGIEIPFPQVTYHMPPKAMTGEEDEKVIEATAKPVRGKGAAGEDEAQAALPDAASPDAAGSKAPRRRRKKKPQDIPSEDEV